MYIQVGFAQTAAAGCFLKTFVFCSGIWYKSKPEMLAYINICGDDDMMTMMPRMRGIVFLVY